MPGAGLLLFVLTGPASVASTAAWCAEMKFKPGEVSFHLLIALFPSYKMLHYYIVNCSISAQAFRLAQLVEALVSSGVFFPLSQFTSSNWAEPGTGVIRSDGQP